MTVVGFVLYGSMVLLPVMLQTLLGYPPLQAGIAMAPRGIGSFCMMPIVGILTGKIDPRKLLATGLFIGGLTMWWLGHLNLQAGYWDVFWPQLIQGSAMALLFVPLTTVTMDSIKPERMGNATSLFNLMRNLGGSIGIAATGTMLARRSQANTAILGSHVSGYDAVAPRDVRADAGGLHGRRRRCRHRHAARRGRDVRHGPAPGDDGRVRVDLPVAGRRLRGDGAAGVAHEAPALTRRASKPRIETWHVGPSFST